MTIKSTIRGCKWAVWSSLLHNGSSLEERGGFPHTLCSLSLSLMTMWKSPDEHLCSHDRREAISHMDEIFHFDSLSCQCFIMDFVCVIVRNCKGQCFRARLLELPKPGPTLTVAPWQGLRSACCTVKTLCWGSLITPTCLWSAWMLSHSLIRTGEKKPKDGLVKSLQAGLGVRQNETEMANVQWPFSSDFKSHLYTVN